MTRVEVVTIYMIIILHAVFLFGVLCNRNCQYRSRKKVLYEVHGYIYYIFQYYK